MNVCFITRLVQYSSSDCKGRTGRGLREASACTQHSAYSVRQLSVYQQEGDLQESGLLGELLDRVAAVPKNPLIAWQRPKVARLETAKELLGVTIDVADTRGGRSSVQVAGVIHAAAGIGVMQYRRSKPSSLPKAAKLGEGTRRDRAVHNRNVNLLAYQ